MVYAVTHSESRGRGGGGGSQGNEACSQLRAPFVEVVLGAGKGRATHLSPTHSYPSLRHRDDAPSPLLLGIVATENPKEDEGGGGVKEMRDDGKGEERAAETDVAECSRVVVTS